MFKFLIPSSFLLLAIVLFVLSLLDGAPPRSDWQSVTGIPTRGSVSTVRGRYG